MKALLLILITFTAVSTQAALSFQDVNKGITVQKDKDGGGSMDGGGQA